eukprot:1500871-Alexandrium_andersonii.AAC.1
MPLPGCGFLLFAAAPWLEAVGCRCEVARRAQWAAQGLLLPPMAGGAVARASMRWPSRQRHC